MVKHSPTLLDVYYKQHNNSSKGNPGRKNLSTRTQGHTGVLGSIQGGGKRKGSL